MRAEPPKTNDLKEKQSTKIPARNSGSHFFMEDRELPRLRHQPRDRFLEEQRPPAACPGTKETWVLSRLLQEPTRAPAPVWQAALPQAALSVMNTGFSHPERKITAQGNVLFSTVLSHGNVIHLETKWQCKMLLNSN